MTISQFNAVYNIHDDRLLFRISTTECAEYRFWLTRRVTLFILSATNQIYTHQLQKTLSPQASQAYIQFEQETAKVGKTDESGKLAPISQLPASSYPNGVEPILVMDVRCSMVKESGADFLLMDLILPAGGIMNLKMAGQTLHAMCGLLTQMKDHANWGGIDSATQEALAESSIQGISNTSTH